MKSWLKEMLSSRWKKCEDDAFLTRVGECSKIKVVLTTNCQGWPLSKIIKELNSDIEVTAIATVFSLRSEDYSEYQKSFDEADLIISMLVADTYPCDFVQTNFLKQTYGNKVISIVNLYFTGYNPDWFYIRTNGRGPLKGPMGDYHNRTIFECWQQGESKNIAIERLGNKKYNEKYLPEIKKSLQTLKEREELVDVPITDYIEQHYRNQRLFFTFNHPSTALLTEYAKRILVKAGIALKNEHVSIDKEWLNKFVPLVNPAMGLPSGGENNMHKGVEFSIDHQSLVTISNKKRYKTEEIVSNFYAIYEQLDEQLDLKKYGK